MALQTGQIYAYNLDGNSTDTIAAANGTDTAITYSTGNGKINQGAGFNGTTSKILLPNNSWSATNAFTLHAWFKSTGTTEQQIICRDNSSGSGRMFQLRLEAAGANVGKITALRFNAAGGLLANILTPLAYNDGNWHLAVVTFSTTNGTRVYVDGTSVATDANTTANGGGTASAPYIGSQDGIQGFFNGAIDIVFIWNVEKTAAEVTQLYNAGIGLQYPYPVTTTVTMNTGAFTLTGNAVTFTERYGVTFATGVYTFTGNPVNIQYFKWANQAKSTSTWTNQIES